MTPEERAHAIAEAYQCQNYAECIEPTDETARMLLEHIRAAIAEEREACAKVAKNIGSDPEFDGQVSIREQRVMDMIASRIRVRQ